MLSFQSTSRAESPAGSTLTLVLDWGDVAVLSPVHLLGQLNWEGGGQVHESLCTLLFGEFTLKITVHHVLDLISFKVSELVDTAGEGLLTAQGFLVVLIDSFQVLVENCESVALLLNGVVGLAWEKEIYIASN